MIHSFKSSPPVPDLPTHRLHQMIDTALMMKQERRAPLSFWALLYSIFTILPFAGHVPFSGRAVCATLILAGVVMVAMPPISPVLSFDINHTAAELNDFLFYDMMDLAPDEV